MKSFPGECPECPKYGTCSELCEEAEKYVNQDTLGKNNKTDLRQKIEIPGNGNEHIDMLWFHHGVDWDEILDGIGYDEIEFLKSLNLPEQYILVAEMLFLSGMNYQEIGDRLSLSRERIRIVHSMIGNAILKKRSAQWMWDKYLINHIFPTRLQQDICQLVFKMSISRKEVSKRLRVNAGYVGRVIRKYKEMYKLLFG